jgi:hypothetical protein
VLLITFWATLRSHADEYDDWCSKASKPDHIVICADPVLRLMAVDRDRLMADARQKLAVDTYQRLRDDESGWIKSYTADCGVASDGPPPALPIARSVIECYKRAGRQRLEYLTANLQEQIPGYQPRAASQNELDAYHKLHAQAEADREVRLSAKLKELGFDMMSPTDLELDWRDLVSSSKKIAVRGVYMDVDDVEGLSVANKARPLLRLYSDKATRDARKAMLDCRNSDFPAFACRMIIGATVETCNENKDKLNVREVPCLRVQEAFVLAD